MTRRAAVHNLGCKVNSYELDLMVQELRAAGFVIVPFGEPADVCVVNTCTVTSIADRKSRQMLHRARALHPGALVVAAGCYVETDRVGLEADTEVDLCVGNDRKDGIADIILRALREREGTGGAAAEGEPAAEPRDVRAAGTERSRETEQAEGTRQTEETNRAVGTERLLVRPGRTRADIKIQDGCNQFCTYCIIPYARGRIRSRNQEEIVREVRQLAAGGTREVVLTGIHLSSYGKERGEEPERALLHLLTRLQMLHGLERIRLGSLEPRLITEDFARGVSRLSKVCPHFHLSLQSGCDGTLRRMNRRYTTAGYRESVRLLRQYYDRPAITTDIIVGFPGETGEDFGQTIAFAEEIGFYEIHVFKYSPRKGTPAASFPHPCSAGDKAERSRRLLSLTRAQADAYRASFLGQTEEILLEEEKVRDGKRYYAGHTTRYVETLVPAGGHHSGDLVRGTITGCDPQEGVLLMEEPARPADRS